MTTDSGKTFRNAGSGQYVTKRYAETHPNTTISEAKGGGSTHDTHRSAITGRFVGPAEAGRWPDRTIKDS